MKEIMRGKKMFQFEKIPLEEGFSTWDGFVSWETFGNV